MMHGMAQGTGIDAVAITAIVLGALAVVSIVVLVLIRTQALPHVGQGRGDSLLVSDQARDRAVGRLARAYAKGRLTRDELEQRTQRALEARTRADLSAVTGDIPHARPLRGAG